MTDADLRAWMARYRWTVRGLAAELSLAPGTVQRYRTGAFPVPRLMALALQSLEGLPTEE
jgi:hypothetical protein